MVSLCFVNPGQKYRRIHGVNRTCVEIPIFAPKVSRYKVIGTRREINLEISHRRVAAVLLVRVIFVVNIKPDCFVHCETPEIQTIIYYLP